MECFGGHHLWSGRGRIIEDGDDSDCDLVMIMMSCDDYDDKDCADISTAVPWTDLKAEVLRWTLLVPVHYVSTILQ